MSILEIINEAEREHAEPARVGESRYAKLTAQEAATIEPDLDRVHRGWRVKLMLSERGTKKLRYTRQ